jgi:hypothetical protein
LDLRNPFPLFASVELEQAPESRHCQNVDLTFSAARRGTRAFVQQKPLFEWFGPTDV